MYKINVKSSGKYNNVALGERYVFSKHKAKELIEMLVAVECDIEITKFLKCGNCWMWSYDHNL